MAELLTAQQVAAEWQCSPEHVQRLAKRGLLSGVRLAGRPWRFTPEAVAAFLAAHTTEGRATCDVATAAATERTRQTGRAPAQEMDGALPDRWWERQADTAASPAAGRARGAGTKKRRSARN